MTDRKSLSNQSLVEPLTERELEVLQLITNGLTNREIAQQLYVTLSTVKWHIKQIYGKLQAQNRSDAISIAVELELVDNQTDTATLHNLPFQISPLIGREQELLELDGLVNDPQINLISIVGIGGIGKTRLAIEVAREHLTDFKDGAFFVSLAPLSSPDLIASQIADAVGFDFYQDTDPEKQLIKYFREKQILLLLDNFEHLLEGVNLVDDILANAPQVKSIVTSRERLNLYNETIYALKGIAYPPVEQSHTLEELSSYAAIRLFRQIAQRVGTDFELNSDNMEAVIRICEYLQGMPLAIEMAAAWVRMLSVAEIETELMNSLDLLQTRRRDISQHHQTVRAIFDQSWQLLQPDEQEVFRALSVFRGGFEREAAEQVTGATLVSLRSLADKSLLYRGAAGRYQIHELLRQYAAEKLSESPDHENVVLDSHCSFYAVFVARRLQQLKGGGQDLALYEMSNEIANIRLGLQHALDKQRISNLKQYLNSLHRFFFMRNQFRDGLDISDTVVSRIRDWLKADHEVPPEYREVYALALANQGFFYVWQADLQSSRQILNQSLAILNEINERREMKSVLNLLGQTSYAAGDYHQAEKYYLRALEFCVEFDDQWLKAVILDGLGKIAYHRGDYEKSEQRLEEAQHICEEMGDNWQLSIILHDLSRVAAALNQYKKAQHLLQGGLELNQEFDDHFGIAYAQGMLGMIEFQQGHFSEAYEIIYKSLATLSEMGVHSILARAQWQLGKVATALADLDVAREHFYAALTLTNNDHSIASYDILNIILGIGSLFASEGELEKSLRLVMVILKQPDIAHDIEVEAEDLLGKLKFELAPEIITTIEADARTLDVESVIKSIIRELET